MGPEALCRHSAGWQQLLVGSVDGGEWDESERGRERDRERVSESESESGGQSE